MPEFKLKNREKLLSDIESGLQKLEKNHPHTKLGALEVIFMVGGAQRWAGSLGQALNAISNDLFFNEDGDFSDADSAEVGVM